MRTIIDALLTGPIVPFSDETSAIAKHPVTGPRAIGPLGIEGDAQADLSVHGGVDKAVHHYPRDHYPFWRDTLGPLSPLDAPGAFGENISTVGLTEDDICIGDRLRLGTALVEVSQGRQPCWKQAHRLNDTRILATMVRTRRCGWYYRVIEPGTVAAGDALVLQDRPHPGWTVARAIALLIGGEGKRDPAALVELSALEVLSQSWRSRARQIAAPGRT